MVNFTVEEIRGLMDLPDNIRNFSVIAHVDHGKSTLTDSLIGAAGIIAKAKAGDTRFMDTRPDEQERTITIKSTAVSLYFAMEEVEEEVVEKKAGDNKQQEAAKKDDKPADKEGEKKDEKKDQKDQKGKEQKGKEQKAETRKHKRPASDERKSDKDLIAKGVIIPYLLNLIDSPGHVDFSSEVTAALRVTDGALVVVDCVEGVCVQTETVLRQAISERIKPVLFVNKLDRVILELQMDPEVAFQTFSRSIESVNVVIATYKDELLGDVQVYPQMGTVGFGSGLQSWGFTIERFAHMYMKKFGLQLTQMMKRLWGDYFFNAETKKWTEKAFDDNNKPNKRGFVMLIMEPISTMFQAVMNDKKQLYTDLLGKLNVNFPKDAKELSAKPLLKRLMQEWLPASEALLEMIVNHLPSPKVAQKYRVENLYSGPMDDDCAKGIRYCDVKAPLMMYISKMVPTSEKGRFYAFGRVFSGKVAGGQEVRMQGPDYVPGKKADLFVKKIQRTVLMMGRYTEALDDVPCGNLVGLVGVDSYLLKSGTITTDANAYNFVDMKYSVSPVVRVCVDVANAQDLPKLMEGLKRLAKSDPLVQCFTAKTGEHIIAGAGELHLEICIKDLREDFMKGAPIKLGKPVVSFCETVTEESSQQVITKSPNKHNRLYCKASPLGDAFCKAVDKKEITQDQEVKVRSRILVDDFKWDVNDAKKIWAFGLFPDAVANVLVDCTKGVQYMHEIKDHCLSAFQQATAEGIFCHENLRGVRVDLQDVVMHADAIHRGAGQIGPPMKAAVFGLQICSGPALLEPMYECEITVPVTSTQGVYSTLNARRAQLGEKVDRAGTPLTVIKAYLPVLESFGFTGVLRQATGGQAFPQMIFSHWELMTGDPMEEGSLAGRAILEVRARKGLDNKGTKYPPNLGDYHEKL